MSEKAGKRKGKEAWRVNVEIAPGNASRLGRYLDAYNSDPERSKAAMTLTDLVNEALDRFFKSDAPPVGGKDAAVKAARAGGSGKSVSA